ncbi:MAG TPA: hypothetical protein VNH20_07015 [Candidatus Dormibacteraeota bacterium]|nr:hypothetical protein [Candidatus Dormibacteraeota bacterium]
MRLLAGASAAIVLAAIVAGCGGSGPSLSSMEGKVKSEVGSHWGVSGIASVSCVMPSSWNPGKTFTCYVYEASGTSLGVAHGTVLPPQGGYSQAWNLQWVPSF